MEELEEDGTDSKGYPMGSYNVKLDAGLRKLIKGDFQAQVRQIDEGLNKTDKMLNGRQLLWLISRQYQYDIVGHTTQQRMELLNSKLKDNNLQAFIIAWEKKLMYIDVRPPDAELEHIFSREVRKCPQFKSTWDLYDMQITQKKSQKDYKELLSMAKVHLEQR